LQATLEKNGLINPDKVLNLDIDNYYNSILHMTNAKENSIKETMKLFKERRYKRRMETKLPFENK